METKHTKEYAEKIANLSLPIKLTDSYVQHNKIQHNRKYFTKGYMEAIKQTAVPELLEALMSIVTKDGFITTTANKEKALKAIKKATT